MAKKSGEAVGLPTVEGVKFEVVDAVPAAVREARTSKYAEVFANLPEKGKGALKLQFETEEAAKSAVQTMRGYVRRNAKTLPDVFISHRGTDVFVQRK